MRLRLGPVLVALVAFACLAPSLRAADDPKKPEAKPEESSPALMIDYGTLSDVPEVEPNNGPAQATLLGCGNTLRPAAIAVQTPRDTDWVKFTANAGDMILFGTDHDGATPIGDTRISILSSDGTTVLGTDDDGGPAQYSLLALCAPYTGTYYGQIAGRFSTLTGTYMAFVTCGPSGAPNDQCAGATPITCGVIGLSGTTANACPDYTPAESGCTGFVANGRDVVYKVNAFAGDSLYIDYVQDTADASIYVVTDCSNPAGACVAGEDSTLVGGHETLSYTFPSAGTYYIIFDSFSPGSGGTWSASGVLACAADRFDTLNTVHADVDLQGPWGAETVALNGSLTLGTSMHALRLDFFGAESVPTEVTQLELTGTSLNAGPVTVRMRLLPPFQRSLGTFAEIVNATPDVLDLPPFTPSGSATIQLKPYLEVEIPALKLLLHSSSFATMNGLVHHMPADTTDSLTTPFNTPLVDANGQSSGYALSDIRMTPLPAVADDPLANPRLTLDLQGPLGLETVTLKGTAVARTWLGNVGDTEADGLEQVATGIPSLTMSGVSEHYGPIHVSLAPPGPHALPATLGEIEENVNSQTARLDLPPFAGSGTAASYYDLYFTIEIGDSLFHHHAAKHLFGTLSQVPPGAGAQYRNFVTTPLFNAADAASAYQARRLFFTPYDVKPSGTQRDSFPASRLALEVSGPWGFDELVFTGLTKIDAYLGSLADDGDADLLEQMGTRLVSMDLTSPGGVFGHVPGPVTIHLSDSLAFGAIEEAANYTPGLLDLRPFTPVGGGTGAFPTVRFEVDVPGPAILHLAQPAALLALGLDRLTAGSGDTYRFDGEIALVDQAEQPSELAVTALRLTPLAGGSVDVPDPEVAPAVLAIQEIRPNPTAGSATVTLAMPRRGSARLSAYDVNGRLVRTLWNGELEAGVRTITWDGRTDRGDRAPGGIYFLRFESESRGAVKRLAILR